jgi:GNAT superfamily N-acetyltransferase
MMTRGTAGHRIVRATRADIETLGQVIAGAFHDLAVSRWLIPDPDARRALFPGYFQIILGHTLAGGTVRTTPQRTAAALWLPVTGPAAPPDGYAAQLAQATGPYLDRFAAFDDELARRHPAGAMHHYLAILAVRPDQQGQGTGTALLQAHHATLDGQNIASYLEASDERTRDLYLRHGYVLRPDAPIRLPDGPEMWPMVRQPRTTGNG